MGNNPLLIAFYITVERMEQLKCHKQDSFAGISCCCYFFITNLGGNVEKFCIDRL